MPQLRQLLQAHDGEALATQFCKICTRGHPLRRSLHERDNIAEGNGKHTAPDRSRYLDSARGSALECAACLDVLVAKGKCSTDQIEAGKALLQETVSLLVGLGKSIDPDRFGEEPGKYTIPGG